MTSSNAQLVARKRRSHRPSLVALGVLAVIVLASLIYRVWTRDDSSSPYPPAAVNARISLTMPSNADRQAAIDALAGPGRLTSPVGGNNTVNGAPLQLVVGQLTLTVPHNAPSVGQYAVFVIDNTTQLPSTTLYGVGPVGSTVGQGWDGIYTQVAKRYTWLSGLAPIKLDDGSGYGEPGMALSFPPNTHGPITLVTQLDPGAPPVKDLARDVTVALVFIGGSGTIHWAERVPIS